MVDVAVRVTGAKELRRAARKVAGPETSKVMKEIHRKVSDVVSSEAARNVAVRSGRLQRSIRPAPTASKAQVAAGQRGRAREYAGVIHYGWRARGIEAQEFITDAVSERWRDVVDTYEKQIDELGDLLRAARAGR